MKVDTDRAALAALIHLPDCIGDVRYLVRPMAPPGAFAIGPTTLQLVVFAADPIDDAALAAALGAPRGDGSRSIDDVVAQMLAPALAPGWGHQEHDAVVAGIEYPARALETSWRYGWVIRAAGGVVMSFLRG